MKTQKTIDYTFIFRMEAMFAIYCICHSELRRASGIGMAARLEIHYTQCTGPPPLPLPLLQKRFPSSILPFNNVSARCEVCYDRRRSTEVIAAFVSDWALDQRISTSADILSKDFLQTYEICVRRDGRREGGDTNQPCLITQQIVC